MKVFNSIDEFNLDCNTVVTIGKFDGLHRGHKILCENVFALEKEGLTSVAVSFVDPPAKIVDDSKEKKIITNEERLLLFKESGISVFIECPFDEKLMKTLPEDFIDMLIDKINMKSLVVGTDFRFGYKGAGDALLLRKLSEEKGFSLKVIEKLKEDNIDISSTRIRDEIRKGNITKANQLMGRNYFIYGEVIHGRQIGQKLDFPTINIRPLSEKLIPANGVYISVVIIDDHIYQGITNIGTRPTFDDGDALSVETHIIDFDYDIYGKEVKVVFLEKIRDEIKFNSVFELRNQLMKDKNYGINFFSNEHVSLS